MVPIDTPFHVHNGRLLVGSQVSQTSIAVSLSRMRICSVCLLRRFGVSSGRDIRARCAVRRKLDRDPSHGDLAL